MNNPLFQDQLKQMPIFSKFLKEYEETKPFEGLSIAIAHILVPNTLPLIACAVVGGAKVTITACHPKTIDPLVVDFLKNINCSVDLEFEDATSFDYAIDCAAYFSNFPPKKGVVEVTRTGILIYQSTTLKIPIISADDSKTKLIETFIGNPKSVLRGIDKFLKPHQEYLSGKRVAVVGFGKIGRGIAREMKEFCHVIVCDINSKVLAEAESLGFQTVEIQPTKKENNEKINDVDIVISATGFKNVISDFFEKNELQGKLLLNLGVEDEFGEDYSIQEVFMSKNKPFNFNLNPPTENKYIDPILFAHIRALHFLIDKNLEPRIHSLPKELDNQIVEMFEKFNLEDVSVIDEYFSNSKIIK